MARLEGTGKDPLGRYGKGEIFDVPKFVDDPGAAPDTERVVNTDYQELLDKGYAKEVAPEDDPGRTKTQIAAAKAGASGSSQLSHPLDAKLADEIDTNDAYAITHSGDPNATASDDLKPEHVKEAQREDAGQVQPLPAFLGQERKSDAPAEEPVEARSERRSRQAQGQGEGDKGQGQSS